jgi:hypothetical protein
VALDLLTAVSPNRRKTDTYTFAGIVLVILEIAGLFVLGSKPFSLLTLIVINAGVLMLLFRWGIANANALLIVAIFFFQIIVAAAIKLAIGQPLEENLLAPETTFSIELVYFLALLAAFHVTRVVRLPNLFPSNVLDPETLKNIAIGTSIVSLAATVVYIGQSAEVGQELGEVSSTSSPIMVAIRGFGTLGIVAATARAVLLSEKRRVLDPVSGIIFVLSVAVGLSTNSREGVAAPIVAVALTGLAFGYRPRLQTVLGGAVFAIIFVNYISPALLLTRGERDTQGPIERSIYALDVAIDLMFDTPKSAEYRGLLGFSENNSLGRYFGFYNTLADRVALVQTVDLVADGIEKSAYLDDDILPNVFATLLPEKMFALFGYERPPTVSAGDVVAWAAGISPYGFVSYLAVPENAEAFAVGGLPAVAYRTFFVYSFCFIVFYLLGGADLRSNILAITLFLMFFHTAAEGTSVSLYYFALRIAPQFAISYFVIVRLARLLTPSGTAKPI